MMRPDANVAVYVCVTPVDMRKQASTLALLVEQALKKNIFEPGLYVFSNHRRDRIKIVYWQRNGLMSVGQAFGGARSLPLSAGYDGRYDDDQWRAAGGALGGI